MYPNAFKISKTKHWRSLSMWCTLTNKSLPQWQRVLSIMHVVDGNGSRKKKVSVVSLLWSTYLGCVVMSHSAQKNACGKQSQQRTTAEVMWHCWQLCTPTLSFAATLFTSRGLSAPHVPQKRQVLVVQSLEARRGSDVFGGSWPSLEPVLSEKKYGIFEKQYFMLWSTVPCMHRMREILNHYMFKSRLNQW